MSGRIFTVLVLAAALVGQAGVAAAQWHGPPGHHRGHGHWRGGPPHGEVILVYPAYPVAPPPPQVVYMEPPPVQAVPASDPYTDSQGRYCREYQSTVMVGGVRQSSYGTACLMPDGQWRIVQ